MPLEIKLGKVDKVKWTVDSFNFVATRKTDSEPVKVYGIEFNSVKPISHQSVALNFILDHNCHTIKEINKCFDDIYSKYVTKTIYSYTRVIK